MKRLALVAALMGTCAFSTASMNYEPIIDENNIARAIYGLPEGVEIERLETRLGICGKTADIVMDEYGYQIWCGEYALMHPSLGGNRCFGETLERRMILTDIADKWNDVNCDGIIELYQSGQDDVSVSYLDYSTVQMIEEMGMQAAGDVVENAARFLEEANRYDLLLFDMNKKKAEKLWESYRARHSQGENNQ